MALAPDREVRIMTAAHQRAYRERQRGGPPRTPAPCGTYAAYRRHQRHGDRPCDACRETYNEHQRQMYRNRKG